MAQHGVYTSCAADCRRKRRGKLIGKIRLETATHESVVMVICKSKETIDTTSRLSLTTGAAGEVQSNTHLYMLTAQRLFGRFGCRLDFETLGHLIAFRT